MATKIGILLLQTGTPDAPTPKAVRAYLRRFLSEPRVIEVPRPIWWMILNLAILPFRPRASAEKYRRIWDEKTGSPLDHYTRLQADLLQEALPDGYVVRHAMRYSAPFIPDVVDTFVRDSFDRLVVFPMYPQYSATTTAAVLDELFRSLMRLRAVPALHVVPPYFEHPLYIRALARLLSEQLEKVPPPDRLILSFHGIPKSYADKGDPYPVHCRRTFDLLCEQIPLERDKILFTFQSRFGRQEWLQPYTDKTLEEIARNGNKHVAIAAPGFTADCLETVEELGLEGAQVFRNAGGETLTRLSCLNDHPSWIEAMKTMVLEETPGSNPV